MMTDKKRTIRPDRERDVQRAVRVALGRETDLVLWRNSVGLARHGARVQRFGLAVGSSDLIGIGPGGRFVAIEIKRPGARVRSQAQAQFLALISMLGGYTAVVRSVEEAREALDRWRHHAAWRHTLP